MIFRRFLIAYIFLKKLDVYKTVQNKNRLKILGKKNTVVYRGYYNELLNWSAFWKNVKDFINLSDFIFLSLGKNKINSLF